MGLLTYPLTHPYPKRRIFEPLTAVALLIAVVILIPVNIFTNGFEIVPDFRPDYTPTDTVPFWWNSPQLPKLLRRKPPACQPKDLGRGDVFRLTPSLFEYKVLSSWHNLSVEASKPEQTRIDYRGASFNSCRPYEARLDFSQVDWTQTVTTAIVCQSDELNLFMESTVTFANDISKDMIGQYYGYDTNPFYFLSDDPHDYRKAVFGVLDIISTDSIMIMHGQHLASPILALSVRVDLDPWLDDGNMTTILATVSYINGTVGSADGSMGSADVYQGSVHNLIAAVTDAVLLDLGSEGPGNIFLNQAAVNSTIVSNRAPSTIGSDNWLGDTNSWFYGSLTGPYQTWAEMLRAGLPANITLGSITNLPGNSQIVTSYLCPTYQRKPIPSFLSSLFVSTMTMLFSVYAAWMAATTLFVKKWVEKPCFNCTCGQPLQGDVEKVAHSKHEHGAVVPESGGSLPPPISSADSAGIVGDKEKSELGSAEVSVHELPKQGGAA